MPYYAVARGREVGIYSSWRECRPQVYCCKGARYRKFENLIEAKEYCENDGRYYIYPVYVDGACRNNGRENAKGGYGVYYGDEDPRNVSVPLDRVDPNGIRPTNQRAELWAMNHALKNILNELQDETEKGKAIIYSDSIYAINCLTKWPEKWIYNGWQNSRGRTISNQELIEENYDLYESINEEYDDRDWGSLRFVHVKGHSGVEGNEEADRLANLAVDEYGQRSIFRSIFGF
ncbi:ribonuclease HI [Candida albicans P57072]|uniref:Ribonuclease H n=3 Tax=Candida albicans TaxID=5476 RepID=A0A1D8PQ03_CANAL|nr:uncharacterized protein CAALFM_C602880WA [Candida albicans SC5314]KGQ86155.1 ribonuclease HI [Candida albicans P37005]KGQ88517.1 ribonuclease HI [Candida albicans GC75]KGR05025.1 ribonuclease HI [Candida albicans P57072]KGR07503.1 ribonuclease HI [Candida albicans P78048]KGT65769.1 ribonuclease HI [Candida albicans 12C]KGU04231.1 ribonuclease HI [Candida albicans P87]KGU05570.1 ribonuclease HI [Candida albicans 19F]KGU06045.1 ribonuclease HI [Candida albicans L26]KGU22722.1 ribonuclease|eukprot:XP_719126.2 hypothetical protein CAALFM_C602880WA [Candida albicans SC5314]